MTEPKIQKLESIEDLEMLLAGDVIEVELKNELKQMVFVKAKERLSLKDDDSKIFLERGLSKIIEYTIPKWHMYIGNGTLVIKSDSGIESSEYEKFSGEYKPKNELLKRAGL